MSAKEMFEKLGYETLGLFKPLDKYIVIAYKKEAYDEEKYIYFYGEKDIRVVLENKKGNIYPPFIDLNELQAINKQIEELGWK